MISSCVRRVAVPSASRAVHAARAMSSLVNGFVGAVGSTPLLHLKTLSEETGANIYAKAEFMNPGGSVKDRAALGLLIPAEEAGILSKGSTVVEGTAGNTGIGLAHVCNARGYKCIIYMPDTQSQEKIDLLRVLGAEVRLVPAVAITDPAHFNWQARDFAQSSGAFWANQFDNTDNRAFHEATTGAEIWEGTAGSVTAFTCATGTGGTLAGVSRALKNRKPDVQIILADPPGSVLHSWVQSGGKLMERSGTSITEGIGQGRVTANLSGTELDGSMCIPDEESVDMVFRMLHEEGLFLGASSGLNIAAAKRVALEQGPGSTVVTVACDGGSRYQSRLFNTDWLERAGLLSSIPQKYRP